MTAWRRSALAMEWHVTLALLILAALVGAGCLAWGVYMGRRGQLTRGDLARARQQLVRTWQVSLLWDEEEEAIPFDLAHSLERIMAWQFACTGAGALVGTLVAFAAALWLLPLGSPMLPMMLLAPVLFGGMIGCAQGSVTSAKRLAAGPDAAGDVAHAGPLYRRWRLTLVTLALLAGECVLTWWLAPRVLGSARLLGTSNVPGVWQSVDLLLLHALLMVLALLVMERYTWRLVWLPGLRLTEDEEWAVRLVGAEGQRRHTLLRSLNGLLPTSLIFFAMGPYGVFLAFARFTSPLEYGLTLALLGLYLGTPVVAWVVLWAQGRLRWRAENPGAQPVASAGQ